MQEENTFEDPKLAQEWIQAIEAEKDGSRDKEIYPLLRKWSEDIAPGVLVEIGAGQGICSSKVEIKNKYVGVEPSSTLVERAKVIYPEKTRNS